MPLFAIIGFDTPGSKRKRIDELEPHIKALNELKKVGRLFAAGPLRASTDEDADDVGSILIIDFDNQQDAEQWFAQEPYSVAGVYESVTIKPYIDAMDFVK